MNMSGNKQECKLYLANESDLLERICISHSVVKLPLSLSSTEVFTFSSEVYFNKQEYTWHPNNTYFF